MIVTRAATHLIILLFTHPLYANWFVDEVKDRGCMLLNDAESGAGLFTEDNAFTALVFLSSIGIAFVLDENIRDFVQSNKTNFLTEATDITNKFGSATIMTPLSLGLYGTALLTGNQKFKDMSFTAWESIQLAGFITLAMKWSFGRSRPFNERGSTSFSMFHPERASDALPSGHTTVAFAFFTPYAEELGPPYSYILYFLASTTAFARIYRDVHWTSDVLLGAGIGYIVGRSLVHLHKKYRNLPKIGYMRRDNSDFVTVSVGF